MDVLRVSMFGKLQVRLGRERLTGSMPQKARELLAYLLLHRRGHPRERLATLLWRRGTTKRAKAYLRKALWQLRKTLSPGDTDRTSLLEVDGDWVQIPSSANLRIDVEGFQDAFDAVRDGTAASMSDDQVRGLEEAVSLYAGDLLENWYQGWCLRERERLKDILLRMLDRLTRRCEQEGRYDTGIRYGLRALRIDPARERIHRHLMRLRARAGDRTGALRQYNRCAKVLNHELGVIPTTATRHLHERIQKDLFPSSSALDSARAMLAPMPRSLGDGRAGPSGSLAPTNTSTSTDEGPLWEGIDRIRKLQGTLVAVQRQIRRDIETVEGVLRKRR